MEPNRSVAESKRLHQRALDTLPGGVSHNVRYEDPHPIYIERAEGPHVWDADGNKYVDFWMNHLVSVLGHSYPDVVEAVQKQAEQGLHYGAMNKKALRLAERVQDFVPSAERVRFCASGTEATMYAVRLARAHTGNDVILKPTGGWHGGSTDLSAYVNPPLEQPESAGLPSGSVDDLYGFPMNDTDAVQALLEKHDVAGVILEPVLLTGAGGSLDTSFLQFLKDESEERGFELIFDEVVTGFRVSPGSYQARIDIVPDITTLGKVLGGGLPVGALCGRAELFENTRPDTDISPDERVLAGGGTFTANPMTATAGLKTLEVLDNEPVYQHTEQKASRLRDELNAIYEELGIDAVTKGLSSLFLSHFQPESSLNDIRSIKEETNKEALHEFHTRLADRGYYFLPGHTGSISYQTTDEHIDGFIAAAEDVVATMQSKGAL
ncbi:aspartate aminotransferase family protein [Salinarchaeum sp. IM2453]|uniref:aspartate aminotransferase family protein n=1 Tax=Salinarchaeum sp. IM2453 TaxID=2862870 RepID=UPI001C828E9D|nr:aspartate aminotransferase family protein [Salinarchaeum sp. IM2453]QZA88103.1 aspartate aminotransferase family protein [Salinarchaeum sp. IM2453]